MNKLVSGAIGVEVPIAPNTNKVYLPDVAILRNRRIKHIDYCSSQSVRIKTPSGRDFISTHVPFITLVEKNTQAELIRNLPLNLLNPDDDRLFINKIIDFPHSFIDLTAIPENDKAGKAIYLVFWYDEPEVWGQIPDKNNRTEIHPLELKLSGKRTYFSENKTLLNKRFQNIILSLPANTPMGNEGINEIEYNDLFLTLRRGNIEFFSQIPLGIFYQLWTSYPLRLQNIVFDMQTSYIESNNPVPVTDKSVFFNVIIDDNKKK